MARTVIVQKTAAFKVHNPSATKRGVLEPISHSISIASDSHEGRQVIERLGAYGLLGIVTLRHQTSGREDVAPAATSAVIAEDTLGNRLCLKFYADSVAGRDDLRSQAELLQHLQVRIGVPRVVGVEQDPAVFGLPVLITTFIGEPLDHTIRDITGMERARLAKEIADCISALAKLEPVDLGLQDMSADDIAHTVSAGLAEDAAWYNNHAPSDDPEVHTLVTRGADMLAAYQVSPHPACLAHHDLTGGNIMVRERRLAGFVDWDYAGLDLPERDVGSCISGFLATLPIPLSERAEMMTLFLACRYSGRDQEAETASFIFALDSILDWLIGGKNAPRHELIWAASVVLERLSAHRRR